MQVQLSGKSGIVALQSSQEESRSGPDRKRKKEMTKSKNRQDVDLQQLDELTLVLTAGSLRMSDEERLQAIDRIHTDIQDKLFFLTAFNQEHQILAINRAKASQEIRQIKNLYAAPTN